MQVNFYAYRQYVLTKLSLFQNVLSEEVLKNNQELKEFIEGQDFNNFDSKTEEEKIELLKKVQELHKTPVSFSEETLLETMSISPQEVAQFIIP